MKLTDDQKRNLARVHNALANSKHALLSTSRGKDKHIITSRLVRPHGPAAVIIPQGALERTCNQYLSSKLAVTTPKGTQLPEGKPQGEVTIWPYEALQDQQAMKSHSLGLVIVDVRAEQIRKTIRMAMNLLRADGKLVIWHYGEEVPGLTVID